MDLSDLALQFNDFEWCEEIDNLYKEEIKPESQLRITIKIENFVPFALINHAEQYINEDLRSINKNGLLIDGSKMDNEKSLWLVAIYETK